MVTSGCNIHVKQNDDQQLRLIAAASHIYSLAKLLMVLQFTLTVPVALGISFLMAWHPAWKIWLAFVSVTISLLDTLWLSRLQANLKKQGATLQQMFDCAVFELPWHTLRCGSPIDSEDVLAYSKEYLSHHEGKALKLQDWYPSSVKALPLSFARLICQRSSLWWDLRLRDRVRGTLTTMLCLLVFLIVLMALWQNNTVEQMILTVYVPLAPAILWILREIRAQRDAIHANERGLAFIEATWEQYLDHKIGDPEAFNQSILLQDCIFDTRSRSPLVFNWVYNLLRPKNQEQMEHKAQELVNEALAKLDGK